MRRSACRLLLATLLALPAVMPLPAAAQEEEAAAPAADPLAGLPGCLKPGATGTFTQGPVEGRLRGTLEYRVEAGETPGTVLLRSDFATADLGPLTFRYRLRAVLEAKARRFTSFTYEVGGSDPERFLLLSRLAPDPNRAGKWIHERFRYREDGEAKVTRSRPKLPENFVLDLLEPFCFALGTASGDDTVSLTIFTVERGRVLRAPAEYRSLGEGKLESSGVSVPCRILSRAQGDDRSTVYLRASDLMPLRHGTTRPKEPQ